MTLRPLGRSGLQVPPLCVGGNVFGWTVDEATSHRLLDALPQSIFHRLVSVGHEAAVGLRLDREVGRLKTGERDRIGQIGEFEGKSEVC